LTRAVEPGRPAVVDLVDRVGPVEAMHLLRVGAAGEAGLAAARRAGDRAEDDLAAAQALGVRLVTPEDDEWPDLPLHQLRLAYDRERPGPRGEDVALTPPLALWVLGPAAVDEAFARAVAVVGSRSATPYGEHVAARFGYELAGRSWTVVSGGAYGIDGAAHRGALSADGLTVAVVAGGLASPYPRGHAVLFDRIRRDGLLVSEWPPDASPQRHRFLVRNRLIAGLTAGTVIVEAGLRSGALATARQALRAGRTVMGVPGPVTSGESAGVHQLLRTREEVRLVTRAAEVVELVGAIGDDLAAPLTTRRPRNRAERWSEVTAAGRRRRSSSIGLAAPPPLSTRDRASGSTGSEVGVRAHTAARARIRW
jgi:DNA processing protein